MKRILISIIVVAIASAVYAQGKAKQPIKFVSEGIARREIGAIINLILLPG